MNVTNAHIRKNYIKHAHTKHKNTYLNKTDDASYGTLSSLIR